MTLIEKFIGALFLILYIPLIYIFLTSKRKSKKITSKFNQCLSLNTINSLTSCIRETLKSANPAIVDMGIYQKKDKYYIRLDSNNEFRELKKSELPINLPERIYNPDINKLGRYYITQFKFQDFLLLVMSTMPFKLSSVELFLKLSLQKTKIIKTLMDKDEQIKRLSVALTSKGFFEKLLFDEASLLKFLGNILKLSSEAPYVSISSGKNTFEIGNVIPRPCQEFLIRGTGIVAKICGKTFSPDEKKKIGRFLDTISFLTKEEEILNSYLQLLIEAITNFENNSIYYKKHSQMVKEISLMIASEMGLQKEQIETLKYAAILHDIGVVDMVSKIIFEKRKLTEQERLKIRYHPITGASIVAPLEKLYPAISKIVLQHHEFCDGSGYPEGLKCEDIWPESGILSLSEVFIGLVSDRPYRKAKTYEEAYTILTKNYKNKFSSEVLNAFTNCYEKITRTLKAM